MCGIVGIYDSAFRESTPALLGRMTGVIKHRGPDDEGYALFDTSTGRYEVRSGDDTMAEPRAEMEHLSAPAQLRFDVALGHRRLSIIDLSAAGHQPMSNEDGTAWIVHNGEIYNHAVLRDELRDKGHRFRSKTDTEVILHSYEQWGTECLNRFNGMWAFAIWDGASRKLFCSRDRFGIKPLYYYFDGRRFLFASEIKALLEADFIQRKPNDQTLFDYLAYWAEDCTEDTFFSGIKQLRGGHYLEFMPGEKELRIQRYYDVRLGARIPEQSDEEYARRFGELFEDSIRLRLISDVPLGTCLSGGLESSSIVCVVDKLMRTQGIKLPGLEGIQKTFSARYDDRRCDEGAYIADVVKRTGVDAYHTYPTGEGLRKDLQDLIWHQEEPFVSTRSYAQREVYKLARQSGVKIALDGQGGDELLAGYDSYYAVLFSYLMRSYQWRELARESYSHMRLHGGSASMSMLQAGYHLLPAKLKPWARKAMRVDGPSCLSKEFAAAFTGCRFRDSGVAEGQTDLFGGHLLDQFELFHLPRLLRHQDKNSMAFSIESRVPFLDYRLVEFAFAMPWEQKIRRGTRKFVLRSAMKGMLPESVLNRQDKVGFDTPETIWLKSNLDEEISEVINSRSFRQRPYFDGGAVDRQFEAYQLGPGNNKTSIWRLLNLELWFRMFID